MTDSINIQLAASTEQQAVAFILWEISRELQTPYPFDEETLLEKISLYGPGGKSEYLFCFLAYQRMRPQGILVFSPMIDLMNFSTYAIIQHIYVLKRARNGGIGGKLFVALAKYCRKHLWDRIDLPLLKNYQKMNKFISKYTTITPAQDNGLIQIKGRHKIEQLALSDIEINH